MRRNGSAPPRLSREVEELACSSIENQARKPTAGYAVTPDGRHFFLLTPIVEAISSPVVWHCRHSHRPRASLRGDCRPARDHVWKGRSDPADASPPPTPAGERVAFRGVANGQHAKSGVSKSSSRPSPDHSGNLPTPIETCHRPPGPGNACLSCGFGAYLADRL